MHENHHQDYNFKIVHERWIDFEDEVELIAAGFAGAIAASPVAWSHRLSEVCTHWPQREPPRVLTVFGKKYSTWPLPFDTEDEASTSVADLLCDLGWDDAEAGEIDKVEYRLTTLNLDTERDPVTWRHFQEVFRLAVLESRDGRPGLEPDDVWGAEEDAKWPALRLDVRLNNSVRPWR